MDKLATREFTDFIIGLVLDGCSAKQEEIPFIREVVTQNMPRFRLAFTSVRENATENYQILEFLGDSVIFAFITWYLYRRFPQLQDCKYLCVITRLKGNLVSTKVLGKAALDLGFTKFLNTHVTDNFKVEAFLEDVFEAFVGALNLAFDDAYGLPGVGYGICYRLLKRIYDNLDIALSFEATFDSKSALKEILDANPHLGILEYVQVHEPERRTNVILNGVLVGTGSGQNKKIQQQVAAKQALDYVKHHFGIEPNRGRFSDFV